MCSSNCSADAPVCCGCGTAGICQQDNCALACPTLSCEQHSGSCPVVQDPNLGCPVVLAGTCSSDAQCGSDQKCCARQCGGPGCVSACQTQLECPELLPPAGCLALEQRDDRGCPQCPAVVCPRPGTCPAAPIPPPNAGVGIAVIACRADGECSGSQKCCADLWNGRRCVDPEISGNVCPAASGVSCATTSAACSDDSQCGGDGTKCCADACNVARCQQSCAALDCPIAPLGPGCRLVQAAPDRNGCQTQCPRVECMRDCNSSLPCDAGSACFESRRCGQLSQGWGCGVQRGDFLCHQNCLRDSDCPYSTPQCNEVVLWSAGAAALRRMCFKCPVPDCPVVNVQPGCKIVAIFGYNGCRQCDLVVCDHHESCTPPICSEPAPAFTPPFCFWNTLRRHSNKCPACPRVSCLGDCLAGDPESREIRVACNMCTCSSFTGKIVCPGRTCTSSCTPFFTSCIACVCSRGALSCVHSCPGEMLFRLTSLPNMTIPMLDDFIYDWAKDLATQPRVFGYEIRFEALSAMLSLPQPSTADDAAALTAQLRAYFVRHGFSERAVVEVKELDTPPPGPVVLDTAGDGNLGPGAIAAVAVSVGVVVALAAVVAVVVMRRRQQQAVIHVPAVTITAPPAVAVILAAIPTGSEVSEEAHDFL